MWFLCAFDWDDDRFFVLTRQNDPEFPLADYLSWRGRERVLWSIQADADDSAPLPCAGWSVHLCLE
jgi:hypothetical protein